MTEVQYSNIVAITALDQLGLLNRWVMWRPIDRNGKPTKVPFIAGSKMEASSTDPETWRDAYTALDWLCENAELYKDGGIGIALGDLGDGFHLCGIDLDSCTDTQGNIAEWAFPFLDILSGTYVEISPSRAGLKAFFFATAEDAGEARTLFGFNESAWGCKRSMAEGIRDHGPAVEVYLGGRYFTFTIDQWNGSIDRVETFGIDTLARLAALMPKGVTTNGKTQSGDDSRSAKAMSIGLRSRGKSYDDMKEAIRTDPSTASWYTEKGVLRGERELQRIWDKVQKLPETLPITEDSLAQTFAAQYTDRLRYDHTVGRWYEWDGDIWRPEHTDLVFHWARQVCRISAQDNRKMIGLSKAATASAVEKFCRADRAFAVTHEMWDRDPWLLGTPNGTVDLRTGILREAMQADFITKATSVAPASTADCPVWLRFMHEVTLGDADLIRFLQQFLGYCLTGVTNEQKFIFIYGVGQNGKTTILETAAAVLSDYAQTAPMTTFLASQQDRHPTELAMLRGSRLVAAAETQEGRSWNEVIIKQVTGTDRLAARFMRQDFFTFKPEFKLFFIGNHKPRLKDVGTSTRRRFCMVPFMFRPAYDDKELANKLQAEHPAILRWLIDGCLDWQQNGLVVPSVVEAATDEYFAEQDVVAQWIEERCVQGSATSADALFNDFRSYVDEVKERPISRPQFTQAMERLGFTKERFFRGSTRNKWMYRGIELRLPSGGMGIATGID